MNCEELGLCGNETNNGCVNYGGGVPLNKCFKYIAKVTASADPLGQAGLGGYMALVDACKMVAELTGSCPGDHELINMSYYGCDTKCCSGREVYCWFDYFDKIDIQLDNK